MLNDTIDGIFEYNLLDNFYVEVLIYVINIIGSYQIPPIGGKIR